MTSTKLALVLTGVVLSATAGCSPMPVAMRADVTNIPITQRLDGLPVAVSKVRDLRADRTVLGKHRDGLARMTQYEYASGTDLRSYLKKLAEISLLASGAKITDGARAEVRVEIDVLAIDVTTDGALAGEETFGMVELAFRFLDQDNTLLGERVVKQSFKNEQLDDRGLVGDALKDAVLSAVASIKPHTGESSKGFELAVQSR